MAHTLGWKLMSSGWRSLRLSEEQGRSGWRVILDFPALECLMD